MNPGVIMNYQLVDNQPSTSETVCCVRGLLYCATN